jgi:hypothetical protein
MINNKVLSLSRIVRRGSLFGDALRGVFWAAVISFVVAVLIGVPEDLFDMANGLPRSLYWADLVSNASYWATIGWWIKAALLGVEVP